MNSIGKIFKVTLYGESHQKSVGVVIDGIRPGLKIDVNKISEDLSKRRPNKIGTTSRVEKDNFIINSGLLNGYSTGSPININIPNENIVSSDYEDIKSHPRPGHADFVSNYKYKNFNDIRGGGRFSGRLTAPIVAAGAIAKMIIPMKLSNDLIQVGKCKEPRQFDEYLKKIAEEGDSVGGLIELKISNMPIGLGEPNFYKLDAAITNILMNIPAVKLVSFGSALETLELKGSEFNDIIINKDGQTKTNHSGGVVGGISNGNDIVIKVYVKAPSSIRKIQNTYSYDKNNLKELSVMGRHDVCIARRAGIVLENALAIVLADMYLIKKTYE
tara:strand:- start:2116 stop:3102 length:987 start_codon:yes stop_codon:yes gene_type:complete